MEDALKLFKHTFIDNDADRTLFLLHGTGGDENDFLFLDKILKQKYNLVGIKGNVDEDGLTRFFRRVSFNVFDVESITQETEKLANFLRAWNENHHLSIDKTFFLGYSNGANILLAMLLSYPELLSNVALLHSMVPFSVEPGSHNFANKKILVTTGKEDRMIPPQEQRKVIELLQSFNANITVGEYAAGHEITAEELQDIVTFLHQHSSDVAEL